MSENFAEMFEQSISQMNMRPGEIITGEVVDINRDVVIVNAGLKSEGVIPVEQFYNENGELDVREVVHIRYTFDERITDGFYTSTALERFREYIENPELLDAARAC